MKIKLSLVASILIFSPNVVQCALSTNLAPVAHLLQNRSTLTIRSTDGRVVNIPASLLSDDCVARIARLDKSMFNGKTIISNYCYDALYLTGEILSFQAAMKLVKSSTAVHPQAKVQAYLDNAGDKALIKAQQLCKALIFFGISEECLDAIKDQIKEKLNCEPKDLLYTYKDFYGELLTENIKSVTKVSESLLQQRYEATKETDTGEEIEEASQSRELLDNILNMPAAERRSLAFKMASNYAKQDPDVVPYLAMDNESWRDLEVMCGPLSKPESSLAGAIDCTSSELGKVLLYTQLLQPTCDIAKIQRKQEIITMLNQAASFDELDGLFTNFFNDPRCENNILSFMAGNDIFGSMLDYGSTKFDTPTFQKMQEWLTTNEVAVQLLEGSILFVIKDKIHGGANKIVKVCTNTLKKLPGADYISDICKVVPKILQPLVTMYQYAICNPDISEIKNGIKEKCGPVVEEEVEKIASSLMIDFSKLPKVALKILKAYVRDLIIGSGIEIIVSLIDSNTYAYVKAMADSNFCLHDRLILLAKYIEFMQEVSNCIERMPNSAEFKELLPSLDSLNFQKDQCSTSSYVRQEITGPATFNQFVNKLFSVGSKDSWKRYYFGRIIATYRLIQMHKDKFVSPLMALAELDMYLAIVRLYKKYENAGNPVCFPTFIDEQESPSIELRNFWSPTIMANPVPNTLVLGCEDKPRNALITGPNTGGKSTTMRGIIFAILMAQALGISPAEYAKLTPFSAIRAYLNITDDPAQGWSLFQCSINRATELITKAQQSGRSLILFDELYNGTSPQCGEALAYGTLSDIGAGQDYTNAMCIATTHFPCVYDLREDSNVNFGYYRVADKDDEHNRYKIIPGIYTTFNGFDIAQESQMPAQVLTRAKQYYDRKFVNEQRLNQFLDILEKNKDAMENFLSEESARPTLFKFALTAQYSKRFFDAVIIHGFDIANVINLKNSDDRTILHFAALQDVKDEALIKRFLEHGANITITDKFGKTALEYAFPLSVIEQVVHSFTT